MQHGWPLWAALGLMMSVTSISLADDTKAQTQDSKAATTKRRDPKGITGISPFMELIVKGSSAYVARDFPTAISTYQEAIQKTPNR
ncbi:MAG TPA: hypothetical protein PLJ27_23370, partial [Polyangiaceae bacterium]|nr:hypothetical protein [Polyangiaceae bacterium]